MTLLKPSSAKPRMFCSVQSEPLVQIIGWMPRSAAVAHHGAQVFVHQRFAADEEQVADVVLDGDVDDVARLLAA